MGQTVSVVDVESVIAMWPQRYEDKCDLSTIYLWDEVAENGTPLNPNQGDIGSLTTSVEKNRFFGVIYVQESKRRVMGGNHRIKTLRQLGAKYGPVMFIDCPDDVALNILAIDNEQGRRGTYDDQKLAHLLTSIQKESGTLEGSGFDTDDLDGLLSNLQTSLPDLQLDSDPGRSSSPHPADELDLSVLVAEYGVEKGQMWALGDHRLFCGDLCDDTVRLLFPDDAGASLCIVDPPKHTGRDQPVSSFESWMGTCLQSVFSSLFDHSSMYLWGSPQDIWRHWFSISWPETAQIQNEIVWDYGVMNSGRMDIRRRYPVQSLRALFVQFGDQSYSEYWNGWDTIRLYLRSQIQQSNWTVSEIAEKVDCSPSLVSRWVSESQWSMISSDHYAKLREGSDVGQFTRTYDELIDEYNHLKIEFDKIRKKFMVKRSAFNLEEGVTEIWEEDKPSQEQRWNHPSLLPVPVYRTMLKTSSRLGETVFVPWAGRGDGLLACHRYARLFAGVQKDPMWAALILYRWEQETGETAELIDGS